MEQAHAPVSGFHGMPDRLDGPRDLAALHRDVWRVMRAHPVFFVVFPTLVQIPLDALSQWSGNIAAEDPLAAFRALGALTGVGTVLLGSWLVTVLLNGLVIAGEGGRPTIGAAMERARGRWRTVLVTSIVVGLLTTLSAFLLIVPAFFFATRWMFAIPAAAIDGSGSDAAREVSWKLVADNGTLRLFWYAFAMGACYYLIAVAPVFFVTTTMPELTGNAAALVTILTNIPINLAVTGIAIGGGVLFLEVSGRPTLSPVGLELISATGARVPAPSSTGLFGLAAASVAGGAMLLVALTTAVLYISTL